MAQMYENPTAEETKEETKKTLVISKLAAVALGAGLVWVGYKFGFAAGTLHGYGCGLHDVLCAAKDLAAENQ